MAFLSYLIGGLGLGSVYAIIALGYSMVYGIAKMLNFAHGDVIMVGAFVAYFALSSFGLPTIVAFRLSVGWIWAEPLPVILQFTSGTATPKAMISPSVVML